MGLLEELFRSFFRPPPWLGLQQQFTETISPIALGVNLSLLIIAFIGLLLVLLAILDFWVYQFRRKKIWIDWGAPEKPYRPQRR